MWRAAKNILPTKLRLKAKWIGQEDNCDLCGLCESSRHILWGCKVATAMWSATKTKLHSLPEPHLNILDIVWEIKEHCLGVDWDLFAVTTWSLWNNRNLVRHGGQCKRPEVIVREVAEYLKEVRQVK